MKRDNLANLTTSPVKNKKSKFAFVKKLQSALTTKTNNSNGDLPKSLFGLSKLNESSMMQ